MLREWFGNLISTRTGPPLQAYLLGLIRFEEMLALQRRLAYDVAGGSSPALLLCEHPSIITVGRHGSHAHMDLDELRSERPGSNRRLAVRWVNRGGGCWVQLPGQLAIYPILSLESLELSLAEYLRRLQQSIIDTFADFDIGARRRPGSSELWVGERPIACVGVAVRDWVTYYGAVLNISPDLDLFRSIRTGKDHQPMTSLERERRGRVRPAFVRQRFLEHFAEHLGFGDAVPFSDHPALRRKVVPDAIVAAH